MTAADGVILACPWALLKDADREVIRAHRDELASMLAEATVVT